jgi:hypothetical protein
MKEFLLQIVSFPEYEKFVSVFKISNNKDKDIEETIWQALSKGIIFFNFKFNEFKIDSNLK